MNPSLHHGAVSWSELMSKDPQAASDFYGKVFPWNPHLMEVKGGPSPYLLQMVGKRPVAGVMPLPMEMPTVWAYYFTVDDVDAALEKAVSLGGKKEWDPMDIPGVGRMAGLLDPQGGYLSIIKYEEMENPDAENPAFVSGFTTPGAFSWYSLQTTDVEGAKAFYSALFGWNYRVDEMGMGPYTTFQVGEVGMGGIIPVMAEGIPTHWSGYVTVGDTDAAVATAAANGGSVIMPPMDIPTVGRIAAIQDPTGGMINLVKYVPMEA